MTIRSLTHFIERLWNWGWLNNCFSNGISITDLDGLVERHGHFLFLEGKGTGVSVPIGQARLFTALKAALGERVTILIVTGEPSETDVRRCSTCGLPSAAPTQIPKVDSMRIWPNLPAAADADMLHAFVQTWYDHVDDAGD